jgi:hydroxymethylglutaryl-CoA reductase (NADPH)
VAEAVIPREVCAKLLRTTPEKMAEINLKKNLIGTMLAGGLRSANAHFANMLLAFYLATGQDAANLVEGSQGFVHAEVNPDGHLYFSCTLPHLIVGTIGNGKDLDFVRDNLDALGCLGRTGHPAPTRAAWPPCAPPPCWCGEIPCWPPRPIPGELMRAHLALERKEVISDQGSVTCEN